MFDLLSIIIVSYIFVFYLDIPDSPMDLHLVNISYSTISLKWKEGFDGGWKQTFKILLDNLLVKEINENYFTFTSKVKIIQNKFLIFLLFRSPTFRIL